MLWKTECWKFTAWLADRLTSHSWGSISGLLPSFLAYIYIDVRVHPVASQVVMLTTIEAQVNYFPITECLSWCAVDQMGKHLKECKALMAGRNLAQINSLTSCYFYWWIFTSGQWFSLKRSTECLFLLQRTEIQMEHKICYCKELRSNVSFPWFRLRQCSFLYAYILTEIK